MNKYYEELDWPVLPDELVSSLIKWGLSAERAVPNKRNAAFAFIKTPWYLRDWVVRNIPVEINENWAVALQRFSGKQAGFHIDFCRDWSYNCVIFGDTGITKFKPTFDSEEETSVKYKKNKWYYHTSNVPHAVEAIPNKRLAVTIFKFLPERISNGLEYNSTAPLLAEEYKKDPYFYYV